MGSHRREAPVVEIKAKCQLWYLNEIRDLLSESNMSLLMGSCFGHLFKVGEIMFQGDLLKLMCRRLQGFSLDRNTLVFKFGNELLQFGSANFCVMSGLKFSGNPSVLMHSKFYGEVFRNRKDLVFGEIEKEFRKECDVSGGNLVRSLKLAYLFIIYGILLMNNLDTGKLELGYIHLMDDLPNVNEFPWGRVAYEYLVQSTHRLKRILSSSVSLYQRHEEEAFGFIYCLQCWAYEVVPALASFCASVYPLKLGQFPRIVKWCVDRQNIGEDDALCNFFLAEHGCLPVRISPSRYESMKLGDLGISSCMSNASPSLVNATSKHVEGQVACGVPKGLQSTVNKVRPKRKAARVGGSTLSNTCSSQPDDEDCAIIEVHEMKKCKSKSKSKSKSKTNQYVGPTKPIVTPRSVGNSNSSAFFVTPKDHSIYLEPENTGIADLVLGLKAEIKRTERLIESKFGLFEDFMDKCVSGFGCMCYPKMCCDNGNENVSNIISDCDFGAKICAGNDKDTCSLKSSNLGLCVSGAAKDGEENPVKSDVARVLFPDDPKIGDDCELRRHGTDNLALRIYNPNETDMVNAEVEPFLAWVHSPVNIRRDNLVMLPMEIYKYADLDWFDVLWRKDGWLENTHIDALMNLLLVENNKHASNKSTRSWTCMEICYWQALVGGDICDVIPIVMPYVRGERPSCGGLKWSEAQNVFGIANLNNNHWVFFDISLVTQVITVYNSLEQSWDTVSSHFSNLTKHLPVLCRLGGCCEISTLPGKPMHDLWKIEKYSDAPKQVNQHDCGIMALKYLECRAYNVSVLEIIPFVCAKSRRRYCAKLFALLKELKRSANE